MSKIMVQFLLQERRTLEAKLSAIDSLLQAYSETDVPVIEGEVSYSIGNIPPYPKHRTWKDKIIYVLQMRNKSMTAQEITDDINDFEKGDKDIVVIKKVVTQMTSGMSGANGPLESVRDGIRNVYTLKTENSHLL